MLVMVAVPVVLLVHDIDLAQLPVKEFPPRRKHGCRKIET